MKNALLKCAMIYLLFLVVFTLMKPLFMAVYSAEIGASAADWFRVIWHGAAMDRSVAAYLTVIPGLMATLQLITSRRWPGVVTDIYMALISVVVAAVYCLDLGLYGSWGFRLDMTPFFYISTSPGAAMASVEWWHWVVGIFGLVAISLLIWLVYRLIAVKWQVTPPEGSGWRRVFVPLAMLLVTGLLIIPIRGSVTVSTMNLSRSYFSENQRLNHAAINPLFSLLYSATHQGGFDRQYRFMDDAEAREILASEFYGDGGASELSEFSESSEFSELSDQFNLSDSTLLVARPALRVERPDIIVVVLESFSLHLLPSLGGEDVASGLDSIAREGILFTNFYGSSFRTDRGLAAIFSGFPAPPTTSLLKYVDKFEKLPSLPRALRSAGYDASYYYGGDANFTNMQAYLVSMGFGKIISDKDFPIASRTSKWGAHDGDLFRRALAGITATSAPKSDPSDLSDRSDSSDRSDASPHLTVIQTSSSHEPFEVPYASPRFAGMPRRNAFAYTDSCLTAFVDSLRQTPAWDRTLLVILPDHYGCWPEHLDDPLQRHRIPLVLSGGALVDSGRRIDIPASQTDLAATLLGILGLPQDGGKVSSKDGGGQMSKLRYSRDIFDPSVPEMAFFTEPGMIGIVTPRDTLIYNPDADAVLFSSGQPSPGAPPSRLLPVARAMLRDLYSTMEKL